MTITIAKLNATTGIEAAPDHNLAPGLKAVAVKITMDGAYAAGGEACDMSAIFPTKCFGMSPIGDQDGYVLAYEPASTCGSASGKIVARYPVTAGKTAMCVVTTAGNLTGVVGCFIAYGN